MMDYEQWMWDEGDQEMFSSFPLLDQKAQSDIQDGVEISDLMTPSDNLLDQLDAMYPTDGEVFPEWMSEKMSFNFLEEIQELSSEASEDSPPALLPFDKSPLEEQEEKSELTDLDILKQLVNYSVTNLEQVTSADGDVHEETSPVTELDSGDVDNELWEALSAASGLSSPASYDEESGLASPATSDASFLAESPASSENQDVFTTISPTSIENVAVLSQPVLIFTPVTSSAQSIQSKPVETKPPKSKARSVIKTAQGTVKPSRKERKKDQNKQAATRYREKKRSQSLAIKEELQALETRNVELNDTVDSMTKEIKYLKDLLQEVLAVKGQLKELGHTKS